MMMAMDRNKLIGKDGGMPWHISSDMGYFKRITMEKPIIMGRVTYESLGKPLPGRDNIVITRDRNWGAAEVEPGVEAEVEVVGSLEDSFEAARKHGAGEAIVIGGAAICKLAMPLTERLYLTVIEYEFSGDTWLDSFQWSDWKIVTSDPHDEREQGGYQFCYHVLERNRAGTTA